MSFFWAQLFRNSLRKSGDVKRSASSSGPGLPRGPRGKPPRAQAGDMGFTPGPGRAHTLPICLGDGVCVLDPGRCECRAHTQQPLKPTCPSAPAPQEEPQPREAQTHDRRAAPSLHRERTACTAMKTQHAPTDIKDGQ